MSSTYDSAPRGSQCGAAKLNETLVARIRREHAAKEKAKRELDAQYSAAAFAKRYQVAETTITKVLTYETWRHVRDEVLP